MLLETLKRKWENAFIYENRDNGVDLGKFKLVQRL